MAFTHLTISELKQWHADKKELTVVDIRDIQSFNAGHISGAVHLTNDNLAAFCSSTNQSLPLVVCCYHGNSSQGAADYLNEQGFSETYSLDGGFSCWFE